MTEQANNSTAHYIPWVSRAAFPIVKVAFYGTQFVLGYCVYREWWAISVVLTLLLSHFMHGLLIGFHEASHGFLRKNKFFNEFDGVVVGILSYTPFTLYRALHQKHHMHLATEKDLELWPYVMTDSPLWKRRLVAFLELNFGLFFIPYLFLRAFFQKDSPVKNRKVRKRVWIELIGAVAFWTGILFMCAHFSLWPWFFMLYFIPAFIAGNLQSWRKYIEHVGLSGNTSRSATRSIIANTWLGRLTSMTLLHEPLHGIHHTKMSLHHYELPKHIELLEPEDDGDIPPYPNYRAAFVDLFVQLKDPKAGSQWGTSSAGGSAQS